MVDGDTPPRKVLLLPRSYPPKRVVAVEAALGRYFSRAGASVLGCAWLLAGLVPELALMGVLG